MAGPITSDEKVNIAAKTARRDRRRAPAAEAPVQAQQERHGGDEADRGEQSLPAGAGKKRCAGERADVVQDVGQQPGETAPKGDDAAPRARAERTRFDGDDGHGLRLPRPLLASRARKAPASASHRPPRRTVHEPVAARHEARQSLGVRLPLSAELGGDLALLTDRELAVDDQQHREHQQRRERRPLEQEADHDQDEPRVLRVADVRVRPVVASRCAFCAS